MKLGRRRNYNEGLAAIRHYANQPAHSSRGLLRDYEPSDGTFWGTNILGITGPVVIDCFLRLIRSSSLNPGWEQSVSSQWATINTGQNSVSRIHTTFRHLNIDIIDIIEECVVDWPDRAVVVVVGITSRGSFGAALYKIIITLKYVLAPGNNAALDYSINTTRLLFP